MKRFTHLFAPVVLTGLFCFGVTPSVLGCGYHATPELRLENMYPGSLSVAVALRKAADSGVIDAADLKTNPDPARYHEAEQRLQAFAALLAASPAAATLPANFSLGFVESHLWSRYTQSHGQIRVDIHTDGPAKAEAVVLTAEAVLTELLNGRLRMEQALSDGLIVIEGNQTDASSIRHALMTIPANSKVGSR